MGTINDDTPERRRVGLIFDYRMCIHSNPDENDHPENPNRIRAIWNKLNDSGLVQRCVVLNAKKAEDNHLSLVHSKEHIDLIKTISSRSSTTMNKSAGKFDSIYFNGGSSTAAYLAAGSVIEVAERVAKGELDSAFAVVRPPGHHAEQDKPMGFCLCNNVAIATSFLLNERPELGISKILIVDWDVHHGNGTQKMFYQDPRVLVFSVHRHDSGRFYPHGNDGSYNMIGEGPGAGYNINVPWENGGCGDADYISVWDHILIPVAKEFDPDMIIISAGFDAAKGDPIGGCCVSSYGYSVMLDKLMGFARGKIVMALEGGYNPVSLANSAQACIEVLLLDKLVISSLEDLPLESTWLVIRAVRQALCRYWPGLAATLPDKLINRRPSQIKADAAILDEVDVCHQPNKKLSNEVPQVGDKNTNKKFKESFSNPPASKSSKRRAATSDAYEEMLKSPKLEDLIELPVCDLEEMCAIARAEMDHVIQAAILQGAYWHHKKLESDALLKKSDFLLEKSRKEVVGLKESIQKAKETHNQALNLEKKKLSDLKAENERVLKEAADESFQKGYDKAKKEAEEKDRQLRLKAARDFMNSKSFKTIVSHQYFYICRDQLKFLKALQDDSYIEELDPSKPEVCKEDDANINVDEFSILLEEYLASVASPSSYSSSDD